MKEKTTYKIMDGNLCVEKNIEKLRIAIGKAKMVIEVDDEMAIVDEGTGKIIAKVTNETTVEKF